MENYEFHLDWLSVTFRSKDPAISDIDAFEMTFPEFWYGFLKSDNPAVAIQLRSHYKFTFRYMNTMTLHYDPMDMKNNKGVLVQIPAQALKTACNLVGVPYINGCIDLMRYFVERGAKVSRLDLAFDDFTKTYTAKWYDQHKWRGDNHDIRGIRSHANDYGFIKSNKGDTFYVGSLKKRNKILRIYDKNLESSGDIDAVRYEFELHDKNAVAVASAILDGTFSFKAYFLDFCTILASDSNNPNASTASVDQDWLCWITQVLRRATISNDVPRAIYIRDKAKSLMYTMKQPWFYKTINLISEVLGEDALREFRNCVVMDYEPELLQAIPIMQEVRPDLIADLKNYMFY